MAETMKAQVLHEINDIRLENVDKPGLKSGEVLLKVKAAGVCGSDIPRIYKTGTYHYPLIPGHEFSGEVVAISENTNKEKYFEMEEKWLGQRVGVFPLIPCMECPCCKKKHYEMCSNYSYLGSRTAGGFAEYVAVPEWNLLELPEEVTFEQAAMLEPMAVAVHAMRQISPTKEEKVAVCGLGTIGLLLVMFLKEAGIDNLYLIGNKEFQKKQAMGLGVSENQICLVQDNNPLDWLRQCSNQEGVDVFFECVGKNETLVQGIDALKSGGRLQLVGNPASDMSLDKNTYWKLLRSQLTVKGSWNSSFTHEESDDWHYVLERLAKGNIHPEKLITGRYALADLQVGMEAMRDKTKDYVKEMFLEAKG